MIRHDTSIVIRRPPEAVFGALLDLPGYDRWTEMADSRWLTPGEPRVGTRGEFRLPKGPFNGTLEVEIVDLEPARRVVFETSHPALRWRAWSVLEPVNEGTRLQYAGEMRLLGWRRVLEPFLRGEVQAGERKEVERLKAILEGSTATGGSAAPSS
jgi:hypothetical protein